MKIDCALQIHSCEITFEGHLAAYVRINGAIHPLREVVSSPSHFHVQVPLDGELGELILAQLEKIFGREIARKGDAMPTETDTQ